MRTLWLVGCLGFCDWVRFVLGTLEGGCGLGAGFAGPDLRSQEGAEGRDFRAVREGMRVFAFNARSGPIPLSPEVVEVVGVRRAAAG